MPGSMRRRASRWTPGICRTSTTLNVYAHAVPGGDGINRVEHETARWVMRRFTRYWWLRHLG